jgi:hypothetical protein
MRTLTLLGPVAAVLLLAGLFENNIETAKPDHEITAWLSATGNGVWLLHGTLEALAALCLLVFAQSVRSRLDAGRDDALSRSVGAFGTLLATVIVVGAGLFAAVPVGRFFEGAPQPDPSVYRYLLAASASVFVIFLSIPAAGLAACTALLGMHRRTAPRWLGVTGLVLAVLMLLSAFVAPLMVFGLWLLVTGVSLAVGRPVPAALADVSVASA